MKHIDPVMKELWAAKDANSAAFATVGDYLNHLRLAGTRGLRATSTAASRKRGKSNPKELTAS